MGSFIQSNIFGMQQTSTGNLFTEAMLAAYYKAAAYFTCGKSAFVLQLLNYSMAMCVIFKDLGTV